jgi:DNA polymerase-3 subunit epsilon
LWLGLAVTGVIATAVFAVMIALARRTPEAGGVGLAELSIQELAGAFVFALLAALVAIAIFMRMTVLVPATRLAGAAHFAADTRREAPRESMTGELLEPLPQAVASLARALAQERSERQEAIAAATHDVALQKARLEAILRDLSEGVLVCNLDHRVLLYNQSALGILHVAGELGLGRSVFNLVTSEPVLHALERILHRDDAAYDGAADDSCPLVCATADARRLLTGRLALVRDENAKPSGYVLTFVDATSEVDDLVARDSLLREVGEVMRRPLANLHAAAETIAASPDLTAETRREFDDVIRRESATLVERLESIAERTRGLRAASWPMTELLALDLFRLIATRLATRGVATLTPVGMPRWIRADSHSLAIALEHLITKLAACTTRREFDIAAEAGAAHAYLDVTWRGAALSQRELDSWLTESLRGVTGAATLGDVLDRHGSAMWTRALDAELAVLRIPVPAASRDDATMRDKRPLPPRPEFYDFSLLGGVPAGDIRPLSQVSFVVFDTETTGLKPSDGDEMISIGAVRVVNGRLLTGETFSRLINPGRSIPPGSIRFHGITDVMVADAPPAAIVLPQFRSFCEGAVLVAHNAAFDLEFLRRKEQEAGVRFDMPAIDTLLVSFLLDPGLADHDLDAIAARLGVAIRGRHTALGDAMATAAILVAMLQTLPARGITTLEQLMRETRMGIELRARAKQF